MNIKDYQQKPITPLTFEQWKGDLAPVYSDETMKSMNRLHDIDYKKEFEEMLKNEYAEYLSNLNGDWLNQ
jgi:hypothetical protein